jgi:hypothetical protein
VRGAPGALRFPAMPISDRDPATARLKPRPWLPIAGAVVGGLAGFAFYYFYGCDSG